LRPVPRRVDPLVDFRGVLPLFRLAPADVRLVALRPFRVEAPFRAEVPFRADVFRAVDDFLRADVLPVLFFRVPGLAEALRFRPDPDFFPPPSCLLTVAQARRSASSLPTPRSS
jgi:hypothetical protein